MLKAHLDQGLANLPVKEQGVNSLGVVATRSLSQLRNVATLV